MKARINYLRENYHHYFAAVILEKNRYVTQFITDGVALDRDMIQLLMLLGVKKVQLNECFTNGDIIPQLFVERLKEALPTVTITFS